MTQGAPAAAPVFEGRRGHPVLVSRGLFKALLGLEGDQGAAGRLGCPKYLDVVGKEPS